MSIVESRIISNVPYGSTSIQVREEHVNQLDNKHYFNYIADNGYDTDAALADHAINANQNDIDTEINEGIATFNAGGDPLHIDEGGWFSKVNPNFQTWDDLASGTTIPFLSEENQLELVNIQLTSRISTNDKKVIWTMTTQQVSSVSGDIQIAIDTVASLNLYKPYFIDGSLDNDR